MCIINERCFFQNFIAKNVGCVLYRNACYTWLITIDYVIINLVLLYTVYKNHFLHSDSTQANLWIFLQLLEVGDSTIYNSGE